MEEEDTEVQSNVDNIGARILRKETGVYNVACLPPQCAFLGTFSRAT